MLEKLISALPLLEDLSVTRCCSLKRTKISSDRLKYLLLGYCKLTEIDIDTPNLLSFTYKNNPINCIMSTTAPCSWKADISYKGYNLDNRWYRSLKEFLGAFSQIEHLNIYLDPTKVLFVNSLMGSI